MMAPPSKLKASSSVLSICLEDLSYLPAINRRIVGGLIRHSAPIGSGVAARRRGKLTLAFDTDCANVGMGSDLGCAGLGLRIRALRTKFFVASMTASRFEDLPIFRIRHFAYYECAYGLSA
jgi:hypothetical protein